MSDGPSEELAAKFHEIYQREAKRQGDVRHKDAYADLPENIKEFDRVLARYVLSADLLPAPQSPATVSEITVEMLQAALKEVGTKLKSADGYDVVRLTGVLNRMLQAAPASERPASSEDRQIALDDRRTIEAIADFCFKSGLSTPDGTVLPMVKQLEQRGFEAAKELAAQTAATYEVIEPNPRGGVYCPYVPKEAANIAAVIRALEPKP